MTKNFLKNYGAAVWTALAATASYFPIAYLLDGESARDRAALRFLMPMSSDPAPIWYPKSGVPWIDSRMEILRVDPFLGLEFAESEYDTGSPLPEYTVAGLFRLYFLSGAHDKGIELARSQRELGGGYISPVDLDATYLLLAHVSEYRGDFEMAGYYYRLYRDHLLEISLHKDYYFQNKGFQNRLTLARVKCVYFEEGVTRCDSYFEVSYFTHLVCDFFEEEIDNPFLEPYLNEGAIIRPIVDTTTISFNADGLKSQVAEKDAEGAFASHLEYFLYDPGLYELVASVDELVEAAKKYPTLLAIIKFRKARETYESGNSVESAKAFIELYRELVVSDVGHFLSDDCLTFAALSVARLDAESGDEARRVFSGELRNFATPAYDAIDLLKLQIEMFPE